MGLDEKKDQAFADLKEKMKAKGADPVQREVIEKIKAAVKASGLEADAD